MPTPATPRIPVHLPPQPTRLIGREDELAFVRSLLAQDDMRLLTLIGPGGVGKTRLAIAAAEQVAERFPDGVWFVDLAPLADPALVVPTIARVVGVREQPAQDPLAALTTFLGERSVLLVVDNLEHLLPAAADLDALLAGVPNLTVLATSREPLRLRREQVVEVRPLPVPGAEEASWTVANLAAMPAVQLFVMRAQAADARFELSPANAEAVAELSRRLEGLPLAVELAAARIRLLEPKALLARMHQSLALLRWEAPDLPPRHRSLHATLDWSYALLTAHQQALFRRLAVFAGGFTLDGAEAVFTGDVPGADEGAGDGLFYRHPEPPPRPPAALDDLAALVDHSLVQPVDPVAEEPRYRMLETVRQFGREQLAASGEEGEVRRRHLVYFVALAEHLSERLWLPQAKRVSARLDAEHDNVRAALAWAEASGEAALGLRLARAMINFWAVRGHLREGQGWLERALQWGETPLRGGGWGEPTPSAERAKALVGLGWLARFQGDSDRAEPAFGEALRVASEVGAGMTTAGALTGLALVDLDRGRYAEAAARLDEALARYQELESALVAGPVYVSQTLLRRGAGRPRRRRPGGRGPLPGGGRTAAAGAELRLGAERDAALPGRSGARPRRPRRRAGLLPGEPGPGPGARRPASGGRRAGRGGGAGGGPGPGGAGGPPVRGGGGAARATGRDGGAVGAPGPRARPGGGAGGAGTGRIRSGLGGWSGAATGGGRRRGAGRRRERGLAAAAAPATPDPADALGLTPREIDVLRAAGAGHSNREIGEALFISPRTVNFHVTNLLAKLELDSRAAAAAFAVRHGLA